jgi:hypothetical protein
VATPARAIIARSLLVSAGVMAVVAMLFWEQQRVVAVALLTVAVVDGIISLWLRRGAK